MPGVADLLGRGGLGERVGGDGGDDLAGRSVLGQGGQAAAERSGEPLEKVMPSWYALKSAMVTMRSVPPRRVMESSKAPFPARSNTASTPSGASARTRSTRPSP